MNDRMAALEQYYKNPRECEFCQQILIVPDGVKPSVIKKKKFCSKECLRGKYSLIYPKKEKTEKLPKELIQDKYSKSDIFSKCKNWQSARSIIQKHARKIYNSSGKLKQCLICGYVKHYEVCHIKSVSSFENKVKIKEINDISNLIALCPNCHWEFDNGLLIL